MCYTVVLIPNLLTEFFLPKFITACEDI